MKPRISLIAAAVSATVLAACSSDDPSVEGPDIDVVDPVASERRLQPFEDSAAFYDALKQALVSQTAGQEYYPVDPVTDVVDSVEAVAPAVPNASPESAGDGSSVASDSAAGTGAAATQNEVTSTTVQEQGVDEQDWVKVSSDGSMLYVLDSSYDDVYIGVPEPIMLPVEDVEILVDPVADEDIAASSFYYPQSYQTTLRILSLDADTPDATSVNELGIDMGGRYAEGTYLYESGASTSLFVTASGNNFWGYWDDPYAFAGQDSTITKVDVSDPATASVTGSLHIDGQFVSSRRIGKHLFFASRYYPTLPDNQSWAQTEDQLRTQLDATDLAAVLPQYRVGDSGDSQPLVNPGECFVARQPSDDSYYSPDIITLGVVDLDTLELTDSECYLGASETLYASPDAVFLATTQYDYSAQPIDGNGAAIDVENGDFPVDVFWSDPRVDTDIHQFDIEAGQLVYAGSGSVRGHLGWSALRKPFRMSEKDGYLRVATFNDRQGADESPILMAILQADGTGNLRTIATLPNESEPGFIGKPGEQLYASRFLGDRAYLVTFRQTDPLYVVDLSNPEAPRVTGELEIEGYSDYLQPVGDGYLLGIGKDAVAAPDNGWGDGRGALVQGVKLALFNVSNPAEPTEVQSLVIGQRGTESQALYDHRAITVQAATDQHPLRVSFGIDVAGQTYPDVPTPSNTAWDYYNWSYSGLHGFDINLGADAGIVPRGVLKVSSAEDGYGGFYGPYNRDRSVMVNDAVFYIRGTSVFAAPWDDLANPSPAR